MFVANVLENNKNCRLFSSGASKTICSITAEVVEDVRLSGTAGIDVAAVASTNASESVCGGIWFVMSHSGEKNQS